MLEILRNLQPDCCTNEFTIVEPINLTINLGNYNVNGGALTQFTEIKLFNTIQNACDLNEEASQWYPIVDILQFNSHAQRPTGIVCKNCDNGHCVISLRVNNHPNYRYVKSDHIELR